MESWRLFLQSKYKLMARLAEQLDGEDHGEELPRLRKRYARTLSRGERAQRWRVVVTVFLALGVVSAGVSTLVGLFLGEEGLPPALDRLLDRLAAVTASLSLLLLAARLALARYLERIDVVATFLAMRMAAASTHGGPDRPG